MLRSQFVDTVRSMGMGILVCGTMFAIRWAFVVSSMVQTFQTGDNNALFDDTLASRCGMGPVWCELVVTWVPETVCCIAFMLLRWHDDNVGASPVDDHSTLSTVTASGVVKQFNASSLNRGSPSRYLLRLHSLLLEPDSASAPMMDELPASTPLLRPDSRFGPRVPTPASGSSSGGPGGSAPKDIRRTSSLQPTQLQRGGGGSGSGVGSVDDSAARSRVRGRLVGADPDMEVSMSAAVGRGGAGSAPDAPGRMSSILEATPQPGLFPRRPALCNRCLVRDASPTVLQVPCLLGEESGAGGRGWGDDGEGREGREGIHVKCTCRS